MSDKLFLVNKLDSNLTLKGGYLELGPLGFASIFETDKTEPSIQYAVGRDWAEITTTEPEAVVKAEVKATVTEPYVGMTIDELKAEQATEVAKEPATGTALGVDSTVELTSETVKEASKKKAKA